MSNHKIRSTVLSRYVWLHIDIRDRERSQSLKKIIFLKEFEINGLSCFVVTFNPRSYFYETYNSTGNDQSFQHVIFLDEALIRVNGFKSG